MAQINKITFFFFGFYRAKFIEKDDGTRREAFVVKRFVILKWRGLLKMREERNIKVSLVLDVNFLPRKVS